jgi:hypothetical protein
VQNSELSGQWASLYAIEWPFANRRARLVLDVTVPAPPTLSVSATPNTFSEAAGANAATGTVTRTGDLSQPLTVSLASNDSTAATVPTSVTIPANQSTASFAIAAVDDFLPDGSQTATVTASAQPGGGGPLQLDPTYGTGGLAATSLRQEAQFPHAAIAYLPDGKLLAASELTTTSWLLTRLNADGTVDQTFGNGGIVTTTIFSATSDRPTPYVIAVQPGGAGLVGCDPCRRRRPPVFGQPREPRTSTPTLCDSQLRWTRFSNGPDLCKIPESVSRAPTGRPGA